MIPDPWLLLLCIFALLAALGATSGLVNERLWASEPLVCVLAGILLGQEGFGLLQLDPGSNALSTDVLREAARVTLAVAVTGAAMRLPAGWIRANWRGLAVALGPGMLMMWGASTIIALFALHADVLTCLLIGAMVTPTDPVLSAPILTGRLARAAVPADLRHGLTAESGMNDGLALPLVMLPMILLTGSADSPGVKWLTDAVLWDVGCGLAVGLVAGGLTLLCLRWASRRPEADHASLLTVALALALLSLAGARVVGSDGVLAAFVAGAVLNNGRWRSELEERQERFNQALARFFDLPVMILFGAAIPWGAWHALGWAGVAFVVALLLLRRLPAWFLLRGSMPWTRSPQRAAVAGWFGPIGAAALLYALESHGLPAFTLTWPVVSLAVGASVLVHGVSATPLTWMFGVSREEALRHGIDAARERRAKEQAR